MSVYILTAADDTGLVDDVKAPVVAPMIQNQQGISAYNTVDALSGVTAWGRVPSFFSVPLLSDDAAYVTYTLLVPYTGQMGQAYLDITMPVVQRPFLSRDLVSATIIVRDQFGAPATIVAAELLDGAGRAIVEQKDGPTWIDMDVPLNTYGLYYAAGGLHLRIYTSGHSTHGDDHPTLPGVTTFGLVALVSTWTSIPSFDPAGALIDGGGTDNVQYF